MNCRHCDSPLSHSFIDLGHAPPTNAYRTERDLKQPEVYYPLKVKVCSQCWLVQTEDYVDAAELFSPEYAYFSSTSTSWLAHAKDYANRIIERLHLNAESFVVEVASNDGYLLKNFIEYGIPCLGIEPTTSTAKAAENIGIHVLREFFGEALAQSLVEEEKQADLIIGNNVYAHIPDINDFTRGLKALLKPQGTVTLEFQHLMPLITDVKFDTIYHEHFSYHSLFTLSKIFDSVGLKVWDAEKITTHGGSLRVYGCHKDDPRKETDAVKQILNEEKSMGLQTLAIYSEFQSRADKIKDDLLEFLIEQKKKGKKVVAYGAASKGNTILNYAGIKPDLLTFVCDAAVAKQNKFMPGSHIPIKSPDAIFEADPDYVLVLPWNILSEIKSQLSPGLPSAKFVVAVPKLTVE